MGHTNTGTWLTRAKDELRELSTKIRKLKIFLDEIDLGNMDIDDVQYELLRAQLYAMNTYHRILQLRVYTNNGKDSDAT